MKKLFLLSLVAMLFVLPKARAQGWKKYRHEIFGGVGGTGFLGEVGGGYGPARDLFLDLDGKASRYCVSGGYRYNLHEVVSIRGMVTYARVSGKDALAGDIWRRSRNLSFRSPIIEFAAIGELYFVREKVGSRYRVRGIKGVFGNNFSAYFFTGIAPFIYSPSAQFVGDSIYQGDNKWYALRKLGTEGQTLPGGKKYSTLSIAIPMGIGAKFNINKNYALSMELGYRYTFTDYIDDVSTVYADPAAIQAQNGGNGNAAAWLSNPAIWIQRPEDNAWIIAGGRKDVAAGYQRGDPTTNDTYLFAQLCLSYKFISKKTNRPKF